MKLIAGIALLVLGLALPAHATITASFDYGKQCASQKVLAAYIYTH